MFYNVYVVAWFIVVLSIRQNPDKQCNVTSIYVYIYFFTFNRAQFKLQAQAVLIFAFPECVCKNNPQ